MTRRLPPFGKQFQPIPRSGVQVAVGPGAWSFQKRHSSPIMVVPDDASPSEFDWPADGRPALIYERGSCNDQRLYAIAGALLQAGAPSVVAIREALLAKHDPRVFFDPVVQYVSD